MRSRLLVVAFALSLLAGPAFAAGAALSDDTPDLNGVRTKINAHDYKGALTDLRGMTPDADVYNLTGYSLRKSGDHAQALIYYEKALALDPKHKGALEYEGELFVETGQLAKAQANAARLRTLCPKGCEELEDLEAAIAKAPKGRS